MAKRKQCGIGTRTNNSCGGDRDAASPYPVSLAAVPGAQHTPTVSLLPAPTCRSCSRPQRTRSKSGPPQLRPCRRLPSRRSRSGSSRGPLRRRGSSRKFRTGLGSSTPSCGYREQGVGRLPGLGGSAPHRGHPGTDPLVALVLRNLLHLFVHLLDVLPAPLLPLLGDRDTSIRKKHSALLCRRINMADVSLSSDRPAFQVGSQLAFGTRLPVCSSQQVTDKGGHRASTVYAMMVYADHLLSFWGHRF